MANSSNATTTATSTGTSKSNKIKKPNRDFARAAQLPCYVSFRILHSLSKRELTLQEFNSHGLKALINFFCLNRMGAYSSLALIRGCALFPINTACLSCCSILFCPCKCFRILTIKETHDPIFPRPMSSHEHFTLVHSAMIYPLHPTAPSPSHRFQPIVLVCSLLLPCR